jgi:hypothetical protein
MNTEAQDRLLRSIYACLRPLARMLMRSGVTFQMFSEVAKSAFVHEALLERDSKGRLTNTSRVAVRTGLSRKEVRRVYECSVTAKDGALPNIGHFGPPARALDVWHSDARFLDELGMPRDLPFEGSHPAFSDLVRTAGGDVPAGAVRAELVRAAAVLELPNGNLRPTKRYFVPGDFDEKAITILSGILFPMIAGVDHNSNPARTSSGFFQRFAFAPLDTENAEEFRAWSREEATRFIEMINQRLTSDRTQALDPSDESELPISGIGVFFYEGPVAEALQKPSSDEK